MTRPSGALAGWVKAKERPSELLGDIQAKMLESYSKPDPNRRTGVLHPSQMSHATWCERASTYELSGVESSDAREIPEFQLQSIFEWGHDRHAYWQRRVRELGILYGMWECPVCENSWYGPPPELSAEAGFQVGALNESADCMQCLTPGDLWEYKEVPLESPEFKIVGRADGLYLRKDGTFGVIEIKTIGLGTLRMDVPDLVIEHTVKTAEGKSIVDTEAIWRGIHRPFSPHLRQANLYAAILKDMGINVTAITFIYEYKANQGVREFTVTPSNRIVDPLLDKADRVVQAAANGELLPRFDGARIDRRPCNECTWRTLCWSKPTCSPAGPDGS